MRLILSLLLFLAAAPTLAGECAGRNLFDTMPAARRAMIAEAADAVPYARGLFWQAAKGEERITLIGTYHFGDDRHRRTLDRFRPEIASADVLLVEAGPEEEAAITDALKSDPELMVSLSGPTLPERLTDREWAVLSDAMRARGIPPLMASRFRPWYVSLWLAVSPCMTRQMAEQGDTGGLDRLLVREAEAAQVPVRALEPWDTLFSLFDGLTPAQEIDMLRTQLPIAEYAEDYSVTLIEAYFRGEARLIWEFGRFDAYDNSGLSRAEVDEQLALAQLQLLDRRNESWIAPMTLAARQAAAKGKGVVAAFGALHLSGDKGILRLLEELGYRITELEL